MPIPLSFSQFLRRLAAGSALLAALACGGGGGGGGAAVVPPPATAGSWGSAQVLETNLLFDSYNPQVAVDGSGRALVVWFRTLGGPADIWAKVYQPGTGWQPEGTIESLDGDAAYPVVTVSGNGAFFVAWEQTPVVGSTAVYVNRYVPGSGWSGPLKVSTGTAAAAYPSVAADGSGNAIVAWHQQNASGYYEIQATRFDAGTGFWSAPTILGTSSSTNNYVPCAAMDPAGNGFVAWNRAVDVESGPAAVCAALYRRSQGWQAGPIPSLQVGLESRDDAYGCSLAMSAGGAVLGWAESVNGSDYRPYARVWNPATGVWSAASPMTTAAGDVPRVGIDATGYAYGAWLQYSAGSWNDIYLASRPPSGAWTASTQPLDTQSGEIGSLALHVNAAGSAALVWNQNVGSVASIFGAHFDVTRGWDSARLLETSDAGMAYAPSVQVSSSGSAIATWYQKDASGIRHIYANRWN
ncbi:hypothetical protein [Geothrix sp. 21YS21S-4]|uniref:hypothetical protein n=1 Tax=Geothrix sp. 21YS21S-4 TaxID=3068889 RepID=UPI0027BA5803|nr:hypothetical protein [Geothrix sp. 21YS21S-4]